MIVDTSAIIAIIAGEPESQTFASAMAEAESCSISAGSWIEATAVLVRWLPGISPQKLDDLMQQARIAIMPVTVEQAEIGQATYRTYGRGTKHRARLNFGDCFAYALAKATGEPLLYKGDDFVHTDVVSALAS